MNKEELPPTAIFDKPMNPTAAQKLKPSQEQPFLSVNLLGKYPRDHNLPVVS
jgi:hypothetical protein